MRFRIGPKLLVTICAAFLLNASARAEVTNSWTNTGSGKWETPGNWSLALAPGTNDQSATLITNAGNNIVTIDATTSGGFADTMTVSNLVVSAPLNSTNTLFLNNAGTTTPLRTINGLKINSGAALVITNSQLKIDSQSGGECEIDGSVALLADAQLVATNGPTWLGRPGAGSIRIDGGVYLGREIHMGHDAVGSVGTLTVAGGTFSSSEYLAVADGPGTTGAVWLTGGQMLVTNEDLVLGGTAIGGLGVGQMTVSNGTFMAGQVYVGFLAGSCGTLTIAGGTNLFSLWLAIGNEAGSTGTVWMTGGRLVMTNQSLAVGDRGGVGQMIISNGTVLCRDVNVGNFAGSQGTFTMAGGTNVLSSLFSVGREAAATGTVWQTGGWLVVTNSSTYIGSNGVGEVTVSNGTWWARDVNVAMGAGSQGALTAAGGTSSVFSNMTLGNFACASTGIVSVAGGSLFVTNAAGNAVVEIHSGTLTLSSGTLTIDQLVITNGCGRFLRTGGVLSITSTNLGANLDADGDGLPNSWETSFNLSPFSGVGNDGPTGDPDGDGFSNAAELAAGTNPTNPNSNPNINSWTNLAGDKWELGTNWVLTVPPASAQSVFITNALTKTVTVDATTVLSNALNGCLTISNLTARGFGASTNTLQLTNLVANTLVVRNNLTVGTNAVVLVTNSNLRVDGLTGGNFLIDGTVALESGSIVATSNLTTTVIGDNTRGSLTMRGGTMSNRDLILGNSVGAAGTLTVAGGTNLVNASLTVGSSSATGAVWLTGGRLVVTDASTAVGSSGVGQMTVSNGTWLARNVTVGANPLSLGTLTAAGGASSVFSNMTLGSFACSSTGTVVVAGGSLFVTNAAGNAVLEVRSGTLNLNSGTLVIDQLVITNACGHFVRTGGTLVYGSAVLATSRDDDADGIPNGFEQSHGLDPLDPSDAVLDNDGDGLNNLQEFLAGTDPNSAGSALRIISLLQQGDDMRIRWTTAGGRTNALQIADGAANGSFTNNFTDLVWLLMGGTGDKTNTYIDVGGATVTRSRYYRLRLVPQ